MADSWRSRQGEDQWQRAFAEDAKERPQWEPERPSVDAVIVLAAVILVFSLILVSSFH